MTTVKAHYVFAACPAYGHTHPMIETGLTLVHLTPDLGVSFIIHPHYAEKARRQISLASSDVQERFKLVEFEDKTTPYSQPAGYMSMIFNSGASYASILSDSEWPTPIVCVSDIAAFFFLPVATEVEKHFPKIKAPKKVAYTPQPSSQPLFLGGSIENSSLRREIEALEEHDPEVVEWIKSSSYQLDDRIKAKATKVVKALLTESDRVIAIPGQPPYHLYEMWASEIDYEDGSETGYMKWINGYQQIAPLFEAWISAFPASVLEPDTLAAVRADPYITEGGEKQYLEVGMPEFSAQEDIGEGVREFLDTFEERQVVLVGMGTIVTPGESLLTLFQLLVETDTPFIYTAGNQTSSLVDKIKAVVLPAQDKGRALVVGWIDQVGVLNHKAILCFVSHCGPTSALESIMATVPILGWGLRADQPAVASEIGLLGLGIDLLQRRSGYSIGRGVAYKPGLIVEGTAEAIRAEIAQALADVRGAKGEEIRKRQAVVAEEIREKRAGEWTEAFKKFGQFGRE